MNIKKAVKLSFIAITLLIILISAINLTALYKIRENEQSQKQIFKLVTMQESMNALLQDITEAKTLETLEIIEKNFIVYENKFEKIKKDLIIDDKDDLLDKLITDVHQTQDIRSWIEQLFSHEKKIEDIFEDLYYLEEERLDFVERFEKEYPKEKLLRGKIAKEINSKNSKLLIKKYGDLKYYSKETLFQHRDKKAFDNWLQSAKDLQKHSSISYIEQYIKVVEHIGEYTLKIESIKEKETLLKEETLEILKENRELNRKIENKTDELAEDFLEKTNFTVGVMLFFTIGFISFLSLKISKNVGLTFDEIEEKVQKGLKEIQALNLEIEETQKEVVFTMGAIGESRSKETGNHVKRVAEYSKLLASLYGLPKEKCEILKQASPMHDIGKVAIPDAILNKPGRFNQEEREIMNTHAQLGFDMLKHSNREILKTAAIVAYQHHEKYDGTGYPNKIKGEDIHIYGRITALADVFDALGSDRVYKKAWSDEKIFQLFKEERGKHFDPKLVDLFFDNLEEFLKIRENFKDL